MTKMHPHPRGNCLKVVKFRFGSVTTKVKAGHADILQRSMVLCYRLLTLTLFPIGYFGKQVPFIVK